MISETNSTKLDKKKKKLDTLCFLWFSTHGTTQLIFLAVRTTKLQRLLNYERIVML